MVIRVTSKNEEDPIKIEGARVATIQNNENIDFSNIQEQLTPQSRVESCSNSNSCKMLWLPLLLPRMKKIRSKLKALVATTQNIDFSNTQGQLTPQSEVGSRRN